ncbi:MAG: hypothetical protein H6861_03765 [Rhodospirillales bacterium]|nr:hypothetical protein [Rhodospirillales bacterium]
MIFSIFFNAFIGWRLASDDGGVAEGACAVFAAAIFGVLLIVFSAVFFGATFFATGFLRVVLDAVFFAGVFFTAITVSFLVLREHSMTVRRKFTSHLCNATRFFLYHQAAVLSRFLLQRTKSVTSALGFKFPTSEVRQKTQKPV